MKGHWLRGILLGVGIALLLGAGVAVAASLSMSPDQECIECWPGQVGPPDEYSVDVDITGWDPTIPACIALQREGDPPLDWTPVCTSASPPDHGVAFAFARWWASCDGYLDGFVVFGLLQADMQDFKSDGVGEIHGEWTFSLWQTNDPDHPWNQAQWVDSAQVTFRVAEDCEAAEEEFVPELGSAALLGSGLLSLAGYATLRWRTRE